MTKEEIRLNKIEEILRRLDNIKQLPLTASLSDIILKINEITDSIKRR